GGGGVQGGGGAAAPAGQCCSRFCCRRQADRPAQTRGAAAVTTPLPAPPRCIIIAGPNGAGKTTFAQEFLPRDAKVIHFVNADLIARGLSPLRPELATIAAVGLRAHHFELVAWHRRDLALEPQASRTRE